MLEGTYEFTSVCLLVRALPPSERDALTKELAQRFFSDFSMKLEDYSWRKVTGPGFWKRFWFSQNLGQTVQNCLKILFSIFLLKYLFIIVLYFSWNYAEWCSSWFCWSCMSRTNLSFIYGRKALNQSNNSICENDTLYLNDHLGDFDNFGM